MSKFNLKKFAKNEPPVIIEKQLRVNNDDTGVEQQESPYKITEKQLDDTHPDKQLGTIVEKNLNRKEASDNVITEKQMNNATSWLQHRRDDAVPVMEMYKKFEQEYQKAFKDKTNKQEMDKMFWDGYVGTQIPKEQQTQIVGNDQSSQLVSNYDETKEFRKVNPMIAKKSETALKDADAMIYNIYRTASEENREVNDIEKQQINDINSGKIRILAQIEETDDMEMQEEPEEERIQEDDYVLTPAGSLGGLTSVSQYGKHLGNFKETQEALNFVKNHMEKEQNFPSIWWMSDHGNYWPIDLNGKEIK